MNKLVIGLFIVAFSACANKPRPVDVIKFADLDELIQNNSSDLMVVNFWATWCAPCVKELPQFEKLLTKYENQGLKVVLVSFDFVEQLEKKVIPFVKKKDIKSDVMLLDETDYNSFIDKIDSKWSGAIPATLMLDNRNGNRRFFEKEFKEGELEEAFNNFVH